ncbi:MAG: hypothetical protein AAB401_01650 [Acidobacteriota bacterium]
MKRAMTISISLLFVLGILVGVNGRVSEGKAEAMQFPVPCTLCPPFCDNPVAVKPGDVCVFCVKTMNGDLVYDRYKGAGSFVPTCPEDARRIKVEGLNKLPSNSGRSQREIICVNAEPDGTVTEIVRKGTDGGAFDKAVIQSLRNQGKCQLAIQVKRLRSGQLR